MRRKVLGIMATAAGIIIVSLLSACVPETVSPAELTSASQIFANDCASCHGSNRAGDRGPDITPSALTDFSSASLAGFLTDHKTAKNLTSAQVSLLADWLKSP